ncbi:MAG: GNAT family N-acetyltransferase [Clostridiales bacterium]|nr:GNAT family N-acetyltransferase [Clostridiales bacterium]
MNIRTATIEDLNILSAVEKECFPANEAATVDAFRERLKYYPDHFWLLFDGDRLVSFVDGFTTDERDLTDDMYEDASLHDESGGWQMIFGVNTIPEYRNKGCAGKLIKHVIREADRQARDGLVLTCKEELINYYFKFGFVNEGVTSKSVHGGVTWYQMRLTFKAV